ncbi:MAG TPA: hypothetical protein VKA46_38385 [Gemmataceae bacterium]|nr:hypothetical protein [Gemmataceae bacterium]
MVVVLGVGFFYGILRAKFFDGFSHFMFDAASLGLYLARFTSPGGLRALPQTRALYRWAGVLIGWPVVMFGMGILYPIHPLVQLVGLRAAVWFLPFLLLGASARLQDLILVARALAVLNLAALAFAMGEYFLGIEPFFPRNGVTEIMYRSHDVAHFEHHRIPATFLASAAYGSVMVGTIPWLAGRWQMPGVALLERGLLSAGLLAAALGTFLCGSRTPVVLLLVTGPIVAYHFRVKLRYLIGALVLAAIVAYFVAGDERMQRFTTLEDTDMVNDRVAQSANVGFLELPLEYPLGAGLGSAWGTSIPAFLAHLAPPAIGAENEYARIGIEQGLVGLTFWLGFLCWFFCRRRRALLPGWELGGKLMFIYALLIWGTAWIAVGSLTAIPGTSIILFQMGVLGRERAVGVPVPPRSVRRTAGRLQLADSTSPGRGT